MVEPNYDLVAAGMLLDELRAIVGRVEAAEFRLTESVRWLSLMEKRQLQIQTAQVLANLPPNVDIPTQ